MAIMNYQYKKCQFTVCGFFLAFVTAFFEQERNRTEKNSAFQPTITTNTVFIDSSPHLSIIPPSDFHVVSPVPLGDEGLQPGGNLPRDEHLVPGLGDHGPIVDAEPLVGGKQLGAALLAHGLQHLLEPQVAAYAAADEHLLRARVRHRPLRRFDQHGEHGLLRKGNTREFQAVLFTTIKDG